MYYIQGAWGDENIFCCFICVFYIYCTNVHTRDYWRPIHCFVASRSDNFIVGLTDVSPGDKAPTLYDYDWCGQYPGAVPLGATVSVQCASNLPAHRYVIVHFPMTDVLNFCELEVFISRKWFVVISEYKIPNPWGTTWDLEDVTWIRTKFSVNRINT